MLCSSLSYGEYPPLFDENGVLNLADPSNAERFVEAMSGRNYDTGEPLAVHGNSQGLSFYSFSKNELRWDKETGFVQIIDYSGNANIILCVDHDGDGMIAVSDQGSERQIYAPITAYSVDTEGQVAIQIWD